MIDWAGGSRGSGEKWLYSGYLLKLLKGLCAVERERSQKRL